MGTIKEKSVYSNLNYDTIVDTFLPADVPNVSTDPPVRPEEFMDDYELMKEYKKICSKTVES